MGAELWEIRTRLQTDAENATDGASLTLTSSKITLGYDNMPQTNTFLSTLSTDGPFLVIKRGDLEEFDAETQSAIYKIPCDLYVGVARETDNTFVQIEKLLASLKTKWKAHGLTWSQSPLDTLKNPMVAHYALGVTAKGC